MSKTKIVYRFLLIVLLSVLLMALTFTGFWFFMDRSNPSTVLIHQIAGVSFVILAMLHVLTKRRKIKKLAKDFWLIAGGSKTLCACPSDSFLISIDATNLNLPESHQLDDSQLINLLKNDKIVAIDKKADPKQTMQSNHRDLIHLYFTLYKNTI